MIEGTSYEIGKLKDGRSAVMIVNGDSRKFVVCSNYDHAKPFGEQWDWGHYFMGDLDGFCRYIVNSNKEMVDNET